LKTWRKYHPTFVELRLEKSLFDGLPPFVGVVDFYGAEDGVVIDWKTTGEAFGMHYSIQGKVYKMLLEAYGYRVEKVYFFSLETGQLLPAPNVSDGWIRKVAESMVESVRMGYFPARKGHLCDFCEFRVDCEFSDFCIWYETEGFNCV
jgi:hypothetical protein